MKNKLVLLLIATIVSAGLFTGCPEESTKVNKPAGKSSAAELLDLTVDLEENSKIEASVFDRGDAIPADVFEEWMEGGEASISSYMDGELLIKTKVLETSVLISLLPEVSPKASAYYAGVFGLTTKPTASDFVDPELNVKTGDILYIQVWAEDDTVLYYRIKLTVTHLTIVRVTFDVNHDVTGDGVVAPDPRHRDVAVGTRAALPKAPQRPDFEFDKWTVAKEATSAEFTAQTTVTEDITVYAQWVPLVTVTFDMNYTGSTPIIVNVGQGKQVALPPDPTRADHVFDKWTTAAAKGSPEFTDRVITANTTVYAQWRAQVTVTFSVNTDAANIATPPDYTTKTLLEGETVGLLPNSPTRNDGFMFVTWYTNSTGTGGAEFTMNTPVTSEMTTIYAIWKGWLPGEDFTVNLAGQHTMFHYATSTTSNNIYKMPLTTSVYINANPGGKNGNVQLNLPANFDVNDYSKVTVKYEAFQQNGTNATPGARIFGSSSYLVDAYFYQSWNGAGAWMTTDMMPANTASTATNQIPDAKQTEKGALLRMGGRQGISVGMTDSSVNTEAAYIAAGGNLGHTFDMPSTWIPNPEGFHVNKAGGNSLGFISIIEIKFHDKRDSKPSQPTGVTVTFDKNGGDTEAVPATRQVNTGFAVAQPDTAPTRAGYILTGWSTSNTGNPLFEFSTPITGATTLYAVWAQIRTVTFSAPDGTPTTQTRTVANGGTISPLPTSARTGYSFDGWVQSDNVTPFTTSTAVISDMTVTAKWVVGTGWDNSQPLVLEAKADGKEYYFEYSTEDADNNGIKITGAVDLSQGNNGQNVRMTYPAGFDVTLYTSFRITAESGTGNALNGAPAGGSALVVYFFTTFQGFTYVTPGSTNNPGAADAGAVLKGADGAATAFASGQSTTITATTFAAGAPAGIYLHNRVSTATYVGSMRITKIEFLK